jgi:uncharacterized membrane protein
MLFHPTLYFLFEVFGIVAFALIIAREFIQKNYARVWEIVACAIFGLILEIGDTSFAHSYSYGSGFLFQIINVPVAVGLGWAVIIYCAMLLSDQYDIPWQFRPFLDALTALTLDLVMDVVAIRIGFWQWPIALNQEWYGVPYENFAGWIFVVLSFSFLIRFIRTLNIRRFWTKVLMFWVPLIAYAGLMAQLALYGLVSVIPYGINHWTIFMEFRYHPELSVIYAPQVEQWKLIVLVVTIVELVNLVTFAMIVYRKHFTWHFDILSFGILSGIHLFFFIAIFTTGIYHELPIVIPLALAMFLVHCFLHFFPYLLNPKRIYFFKKMRMVAEDKGERIGAMIDAAFR